MLDRKRNLHTSIWTNRHAPEQRQWIVRFRVGEPIFIPPARPQRNGSKANFHGWFQPRLFQRHFTQVGALKRELQRLQDTVNAQHVQRRLGGLTPDQYRRRKKLQKLPH